MNRPRLFVELFAGTAAVTLRLLGGPRAMPPVGYMGGKRGFATSILGVLGLRPGQGADAVALVDAGPWGWVWATLLDPVARLEVAAVLRSWSAEDPFALWTRLAAQPPPAALTERTATYLWLQGRAANCTPVWWDDGGDLVMPTGARWTSTTRSACPKPAVQTRPPKGLVMGDKGGRVQRGCQAGVYPATQRNDRAYAASTSTAGARGIVRTATVAERLEVLDSFLDPIPTLVFADHPAPADVAAWLCLQAGNWQGKPVEPAEGRWRTHGFAHLSNRAREKGFRERILVEGIARDVEGLPVTDAVVLHEEAPALDGADLEGCVVYLDPPYVGCTRYAATCPRERVLELAAAYSAAGAVVAVSEAVPLADELGKGWEAVELTHERRGGIGWTNKAQKHEWLTVNVVPAYRPTGAQQTLGLAVVEPRVPVPHAR